MTYDHYRRDLPRLNVLRGWPGNETTSLTHIAEPKAAEGIKSGMVITLDGSGKWIKATASLSNNKVVYWATADQSDTDVVSSGRLLGLSVLGKYELQTPYFKSDDTYATDSWLKVHTVAGHVALATINTATDEIVGICTRGGKSNIASTNSESTPSSGNVFVLNFATQWIPERQA